MKKQSQQNPSSSLRLNAFLASAGLGSRRSVENLIREGRISINGKKVQDLATRVNPGQDQVSCDGKKIQSLKFEYVALNKPRGFACTRDDPFALKTIYDLLPRHFSHLTYAGRLDIESEGLVLLSNDGQWLQHISHPRYEVSKIYIALVSGKATQETLEAAKRGVNDEGEWLNVDSAHILASPGRVTKLKL